MAKSHSSPEWAPTIYTLWLRYVHDVQQCTHFLGPPWTYNLFGETVHIYVPPRHRVVWDWMLKGWYRHCTLWVSKSVGVGTASPGLQSLVRVPTKEKRSCLQSKWSCFKWDRSAWARLGRQKSRMRVRIQSLLSSRGDGEQWSRSWLYYVQVVQPWPSYLTSLCLMSSGREANCTYLTGSLWGFRGKFMKCTYRASKRCEVCSKWVFVYCVLGRHICHVNTEWKVDKF